MTDITPTPPGPLRRIVSLLRTGPTGLFYRFADQLKRKRTGVPMWRLAQITPQLYCGGQHYVSGWPHMEEQGITAIVNLRETRHDDVALGIGGEHHLHLPTRDNTPIAMPDLERGADFIGQQIASGGKVYVHCGLGVGRAPTMTAAYLISTGMTADDAVRQIRKVRPFVHLTRAQRRQLDTFEAQVRQRHREAEAANDPA